MLAGRWGWFLSKMTCFGFMTKIQVFGRLKWAAVVGCPMGFDMYVYIHIASGIYLQTYVMCPGLNLSCRLNLFCLCVSQYLVDFTVIFGFVIFVITVIGLFKKTRICHKVRLTMVCG